MPDALRLVAHLLTGLWLAARLRLRPDLDPSPLTRRWSRTLLDILRIRVVIEGEVLDGPCLRVANHVSWLDIPLIAAACPTRFVAKSEVAHWPIAGTLARAAGSYFIDRGRHGAAELVDSLAPQLNRGGSVSFFPEATTTAQRLPGRFHARLFAAAIEADCHVQPVAIEYGPGEVDRSRAAFVGEDSLFGHILHLLGGAPIEARVRFCDPIPPTATRDELAHAARSSICQALTAAPDRRPTADQPLLGIGSPAVDGVSR